MATSKLTVLGISTISAILIHTDASTLIISSLQGYLSAAFSSLAARLSSELTLVIDEFEDAKPNHTFKATKAYLATKTNPQTRRLRVVKEDEDSDAHQVTADHGQQVVDVFHGIKFRWLLTTKDTKPTLHSNTRYYASPVVVETKFFELKVHKKHKDLAIESYLPFIYSIARSLKTQARTLKMYKNNEDESWDEASFNHPATFETMAMDAGVKKELMEDLGSFLTNKEYYKKVGKAWKRGYLLYGPPGTGKTSLIAAMANHLRYDVYNLGLTDVKNDCKLQILLGLVTNRSILVVEDIDCTIDLGPRKKKKEESNSQVKNSQVTLSAVLNGVDGLSSSCGDGRIIVFTTNHKERLDPALLRPGRMDVHIHMSYCSPTAFRVLATNYHGLDDHWLFGEIDVLMNEVAVTPAEVAEQMIRTKDADAALKGLLNFIMKKKEKTVSKALKGGQEQAEEENDEIETS